MNINEIYKKGHVTFMGHFMHVAQGALVPRPETEILGYTALGMLRKLLSSDPIVVDMCSGSGNLACGIAASMPNVRVWAADLATDCVALARKNVEHLGLSPRVTVCQGDLFTAVELHISTGSVDLIVCNPPYISTQKLATDHAALLMCEPREAFDAGPYGLDIHQRVMKDALRFLRPGGVLMLEFGAGQEKQIAMLFARTKAYTDIQLISDANNVPRVAVAVKAG